MKIASDRVALFEQANPHQANTTYEVKRTGPIVALTVGALPARDARNLLGLVHYEAEVTWNERTGLSKHDNIGALVIGAFMLSGVIIILSVGSGVVFGFARTVLNRIFPGRFLPHDEESDFIRLHLK
jgi:hypothetical protein